MNYKHHFKEGDVVAHIGNISQQLFVESIRWKNIKVSTGEIEDVNGKNTFKKEPKRRFDGCVCTWWEDGKLKREGIHAYFIVPWEIAQQGQESAQKFIDDRKNNTLNY